MVEFGEDLEWTFVMGGLAREYGADAGWGPEGGHGGMARHWLEAADETGMPTNPLAWAEAPLRSTYPACLAVKAVQRQQPPDAAYGFLRALREAIVCRRRRADTHGALAELAGGAGLEVGRFRDDLASETVAAAFAADLELARDVPDVVRDADKVRCSTDVNEERVPFPTLRFEGPDGETRWTCGMRPVDFVRDQALAAGAQPTGEPRPSVLGAVQRFGTAASVEVAAICDLPLPRVEAELAQLALGGELDAIPVLAGRLWTLP